MKRYEFCYLDNERRPMFSIMWDDNVLSACERLLCRVLESSEITLTPSGNYIVKGWVTGEWVSVKETSAEASSTFSATKPHLVAITQPIVLNIGDLDLSKSK